jgi:hypothetical protein
MGIREQRKKLQRTILAIVQCEKSDSALREIKLLKQTIDSQIGLFESRLLPLVDQFDDS